MIYNSEKGHKALKKRREKKSTIIPYPKDYSESDIQSYILGAMKEHKINARSEVFSKDLSCRFDIVVFKETLPQHIIEIKKEGKSITTEQMSKYERFGIPVTYIFGISEAFEFCRIGLGEILNQPFINNTQGRVGHHKNKLTEAGQLCRKCDNPVIKREGGKTRKPGQKYYFKYYLYCEKCKTMYMLEKEKVFL